MHRSLLVALPLAAVLACTKGGGGGGTDAKAGGGGGADAKAGGGPVVAQGEGLKITADELKARLDEQSPMIRQSFAAPERKKAFLDNLIRFELLAREAKKEGLENDPDVQFTMKKVMVSKYYQRFFQGKDAERKPLPDADVQKYYDEHKDEYQRASRVRAAVILLQAPEGSPQRAAKRAQARKLLARIQGEEKKNPNAFAIAARDASEDAASKAAGGDTGLVTAAELAARAGKEVADAVEKLPDGQTAPQVFEGKDGFRLVKVLGRQPELNQPLEQVKGQITARLDGQRKTKEFEDFVQKLRDDAKVKVDDAALEKVTVATPGPMTGMPPGHGGMGGMPGPARPGPGPGPQASPAPPRPPGGGAPPPASAPPPAPAPAK